MSQDFNPNWVSAPGNTISEILSVKNISLEDFSKSMNLSEPNSKKLLSGKLKITKKIAENLSSVIGAPAYFWIKREEFYRKDLKRLKKMKQNLNSS